MRKLRRALSPSWLKDEDLNKLENFVSKHEGTLRVHNHLKTIRRW